MNTGMQDAFNLAWKLNLVIKGIAKPSLLDSYSTERSAVGDMVLRNAGRMTEAAIARNPIDPGPAQHHGEVRAELPADRPRHGRHAVGAEHRLSREPAVGRRRASRARRQARHALARAAAGRHRQVALHWPSARPTPSADLAAKFPKLVAGGTSSKRADARDLILVRPDGYVGFAGAAADRAGAEAYLRTIAA